MDDFNKALNDFKSKYPNVTSGDLQSFVLGYQAATQNTIKNIKAIKEEKVK